MTETLDFQPALIINFLHHSSHFPDAKEWCAKHCQGKWYSGLPNPFFFKFENITDGIAFDNWQKTWEPEW